MESVHDKARLEELRALPLWRKIQRTQALIIEWYQYFDGNVCVSFSGGKDSTVLLHIARHVIPDIKAVFSDTGLEYPEIRQFVKGFDNVDIVRPEMSFKEVLIKYGYPLVSKETAEAIHYARKIRNGTEEKTATRERTELNGERAFYEFQGRIEFRRARLTGKTIAEAGDLTEKKSLFNKEKWLPLCMEAPFRISHYCCEVMKKSQIGKYQRKNRYKPILGTMTEESRMRKQAWLRHGCNAFNASKKTSQPMSFWTEQDVLQYIEDFHVDIAPVYGEIVSENKEYQISMDQYVKGCQLKCTGCQRTGCIFCGFGFHLEKDETRFQRLKRTHPKLYDYCMNGGEWMDNPDYDPDYDGTPDWMGWVDWNPPKLWIPSRDGLGMRFVFDKVNEIYGKEIYRYE